MAYNIQDYGTYDYISLDTLVAAAKMRLGLKDTNADDIYLKDLAIDGTKRIRGLQSFVQAQAQIPIENLKAKLPTGFIKLNKPNAIVFVNADGTMNTSNIYQPVYVDNPFFENDPTSIANPDQARGGYRFLPTYQIVGQYIYFSASVTADYVMISYLSQNVDENGDIRIPEIYQIAVVPYICWQYAKTFYDRFPMGIIQMYEGEYNQNKVAIRGIANMPDAAQNQLTSFKMNTIV